MRKADWLLLSLAVALPLPTFSAAMTHMDAVALYAADASAALDVPAVLNDQSTADDTLARQVSDAVSGIVASGAAQVEVVAMDGRITLRGTASSEQVANQLIDLARAVNGVKEVKSELKFTAS